MGLLAVVPCVLCSALTLLRFWIESKKNDHLMGVLEYLGAASGAIS